MISTRKRVAIGALAAFAGSLFATAAPAQAATGTDIANVAHGQLGKGCSGNGWHCDPDAWCSDFAKWVWDSAGIDTTGITAASGTFVGYGSAHGTLIGTPHVGDAIVYQYSNGYAAHVNLVYAVRGDGLVQTIGGDEGDSPGKVILSGWHTLGGFDGAYTIVRPAGVNDTPSHPAYPLFHEIRDGASGNWTGFAALAGFGGAPNFAADQVVTAGFRDGSDQVLATGNDGNIYHTIRGTDGSWQGWHALAGDAGAPTFQASALATASVDSTGDLHVAAIGNTGLLYYDIRHKDGSWQGWNAMPGKGAPTFQAGSVSMAGLDDGTVQLVASGNDGVLYHNVRATDGTWQGWNALPGNGSAPNFHSHVTAMAAGHDGSVQIGAVGNDGLIYHTIRGADGSWQGWHALAGFGGAPNFAASALAMTGIDNPGDPHDGDMQIAAVGTTGNLYHNIRGADGSWQGWNAMAGYGGAPAMSSSAVALSTIPGSDTVQLIATGDK